jgi:DNA-binding LacI/PurR family transcriptional regulator
MLLSRIENPNLPKRKLVLNGRLVVRGSTAAKA